jgi:2-keto-4-pentenoate hydratase
MAAASRAIPPRLESALAAQFERRRRLLRSGAAHIGWKLGVGDRERIAGEIAVGHLTSATRLDPDATYRAQTGADLHADAELALELGRDLDAEVEPEVAIASVAGYGVALEIVDLGGAEDPEDVVAANVFHRAVAFGPFRPRSPDRAEASLEVEGRVLDSGRVSADVGGRLVAAARLLGALGEGLQRGDLIITGSMVQIPVTAGDRVVAEIATLGRVGVTIA